MSILDIKGQALSTEHRREHDPKRVMALRNQLNTLMIELRQGWAQDMAGDPTGATVPDEQAIDQHYIKRWVDQCTIIMNGTDPVQVDPEAMAKYITQERRHRAMQKPLREAMDLEPYGFRLVGTYAKGELWVSTEAALWLHEGGLVHVVMRSQGEDIGPYMRTIVQLLEGERTDLVATDYTMDELMRWLKAMRRERPAFPDEALLSQLREQVNDLSPRP